MILCSAGPAVLATSARRHNNDCPEMEVKTGPVHLGFIKLVNQKQRNISSWGGWGGWCSLLKGNGIPALHWNKEIHTHTRCERECVFAHLWCTQSFWHALWWRSVENCNTMKSDYKWLRPPEIQVWKTQPEKELGQNQDGCWRTEKYRLGNWGSWTKPCDQLYKWWLQLLQIFSLFFIKRHV